VGTGAFTLGAFPKFTGRFEHTLDEKGRLTIPSRFRARLGDQFVLTVAPPDPCLAMYPQAAWADFCAKLETAQRKDAQYRAFVRYLFAHTEEAALDNQGRLLVPSTLRELAGIERDVVLAGALTRIEVWAATAWRDQSSAPDGTAELMTELGLY
jgi:MraZ protein